MKKIILGILVLVLSLSANETNNTSNQPTKNEQIGKFIEQLEANKKKYIGIFGKFTTDNIEPETWEKECKKWK